MPVNIKKTRWATLCVAGLLAGLPPINSTLALDDYGESEGGNHVKIPFKALQPRHQRRQKPRLPDRALISKKKSRQEIPPRHKSPSHYTRKLRKMIARHNKKGRQYGDIQLYARENRWGSAVKIQACFGDNVLTSFEVVDKGNTNELWFEFKDVTYRNRGRHRHRWIAVSPRMIIRGRHIFLRAQSSKGNGVISLKIRGNCIDDPPADISTTSTAPAPPPDDH